MERDGQPISIWPLANAANMHKYVHRYNYEATAACGATSGAAHIEPSVAHVGPHVIRMVPMLRSACCVRCVCCTSRCACIVRLRRMLRCMSRMLRRMLRMVRRMLRNLRRTCASAEHRGQPLSIRPVVIRYPPQVFSTHCFSAHIRYFRYSENS